MIRMPLLALAAAPFVAAPAQGAQSPFTKSTEVSDTLSDWTGLTVADMDQDGLTDLAVANGYGDGVKVLLSRGGGYFEHSYRVAQEVGPVAGVTAANWNGDNKLDLLLAQAEDSAWGVSVVVAAPSDGTFASAGQVSVPGPVRSMAAADMDGDGDADLLVTTGGASPALTWYERSPSGMNPTPRTLATANISTSFAEDLDGDGILDVWFVLNIAGDPWILPGLGAGAYGAPIRPFQTAPAAERFAAGDLNGDGAADFVGGQGATAQVYYATGPFTFSAATPIGSTNFSSVRDVRLVDLEGDGDLDVFLGAQPRGAAGVGNVLENVNGAFQPSETAFPGNWRLEEFADVSGDGRVDALGGGPNSVQVRVQAAPGHPTRFLNPANVSAPFFNASLLGAFDVDGDGACDMFATSGYDFVWFPGYGDGTFGARATILTSSPSTDYYTITGADLTGDGLKDIVTAESATAGISSARLQVRDNLGGGQFAAPRVIADNDTYTRAHPIDVDGDGDLDILTSTIFSFPSPLLLFTNDGTGQFGPERSIGYAPTWAESVVAEDFDQDGILDLAIVAGSQIRWVKGTGNGVFSQWMQLVQNEAPSRLGARDLDADGLLDLHAYVSGRPMWIRQSAPGVFEPAANLLAGPNPATPPLILLEDFDLDGAVDIAAGANAISTLPTFVKGQGPVQGPPTFTAPVILAEGERSLENLQTVDVDGDGDLDIVYRGFSPARLGVLVNGSVPSPGRNLCGPAATNSRGLSGTASASGLPLAGATALTLRAARLPRGQFGFFVGSRTAQSAIAVPGSNGKLCLGGSIGRYIGPGQVLSSGPSGSFQVTVSPVALINGNGTTPAMQGETWYFQAWFRDVTNQGGATSNFTDAVAVEFM